MRAPTVMGADVEEGAGVVDVDLGAEPVEEREWLGGERGDGCVGWVWGEDLLAVEALVELDLRFDPGVVVEEGGVCFWGGVIEHAGRGKGVGR